MLTFIPTHTPTKKNQVRIENEGHKTPNRKPFNKDLFPDIQIPSPLATLLISKLFQPPLHIIVFKSNAERECSALPHQEDGKLRDRADIFASKHAAR